MPSSSTSPAIADGLAPDATSNRIVLTSASPGEAEWIARDAKSKKGITPYALYRFNEAATGTAPLAIHDACSNPVDAACNYDSGGATHWVSTSAGRGLYRGGGDPYGHFTGRLDNTKFARGFKGSAKQTIELVLGTTADEHFGGSWFTLGDSNNYGNPNRARISCSYGFFFETDDLGGLQYRWPFANDDSLTDGSVAVYHLVIDTTLATASDRVKLYINGALKSPAYNNKTATQDSTFNIASTTEQLGFLGELHGNGGSSIHYCYYAALYAEPMGSAQITTNAAALAIDNDSDPNGSDEVVIVTVSDFPWAALRVPRNTLLRM